VRVLAAVALALTLLIAPAHAAAPKGANLTTLARTLVKSGAPGAVVYLRTPTTTRSGAAGVADRNAKVPMRAGYRFRIASVTKTFVSVVVLQLEGEGKLDVDDPVAKWLPGVVPNGGAITLRELLNHTSGLFEYTADQAFFQAEFANPTRVWSPLELLAYAFAHPPLFAPGGNYSYSNTNYILLGLVVEAVTHRPLAQVLQERIFTPLGLASTSFQLDIALAPDFVHGYASVPGLPGLTDIAPLLNGSWAWAAGAIVSNARDITLFYRAIFAGKLLPAAQLSEMKTPSQNAGTYGLGIDNTFTTCGRAFLHNGDFIGWRNEAISTANGKRQVVVMINVDESGLPFRQASTVATRALCRG
jgi:D-alanyl-D-alanine carboxypeptidase